MRKTHSEYNTAACPSRADLVYARDDFAFGPLAVVRCESLARLEQPLVVHGDAEVACDLGDLLRHLDVGVRRRWIAGGMVVHESIAWRIALNTQ